MKRSIFKYEIPTPNPGTYISTVTMPVGAKILSVGEQGSKLVLWAEVFLDGRTKDRLIRVVGTGWNLDDIDPDCKYPHLGTFLGTVQFRDGSGLVFHVFDLGEWP